jgi:YD repeat-containing protein
MPEFLRSALNKRRPVVLSLTCVIAGALLLMFVLRGAEASSFAVGGAASAAAEAHPAEGVGLSDNYRRRFPDNISMAGGRPLFDVGGMSSALFMAPFFQSPSARSLSLAGGARADVPSSASLNITGAVTVEAWVKTTTTADQAIVERYATYPGAGVSNGGYVLRLMGGRVTFATLKNSNEFDYQQGATPVTAGVWHHVAGVYDGSQMRVYLDGALDGSKASTFTPGTGTAPVRIGAKGDDLGAPFNGLVDEARVSAAALYTVNFTPATNLTPINGVRGLWKFDGPGASDASSYGNHGTLSGAASSSTETCDNYLTTPNKSLSLGGGSRVDVPSGASLNITGAVTVEAWVKTTTTADQAVVERYATYPGAGVVNGGYVLRLMGGRVTFATLKNSNEFDYQQGATPVSTGVWHHVAGVFDGSQMRVYLDGALDGSKASTFTPGTGTAPVRIGAKGDDLGAPFNGLVDEARVSAAALYGVNFTPATRLSAVANTRGLWRFDNQTAADSSGNNNNGTLQGAATFSADTPHQTSNTAPVANAGGPYSTTTAAAVQFSGAASYDADGTVSAYAWNFGDGQSGAGVSPSHAYASGGVYTVTLTVTDNAGANGSATTSVTVVAPPAAPSGLSVAAGISNTLLNLAWADNSSDETGFRIERKTGAAGAYAEVATVGAGVTGYSNTGLTPNTQYFYRVRATNTGGNSAYSNEASAATGNQLPSVSLTAPANGTSHTAPASVTLTATAADADGGVAKVEFYQGATKLGEDTSSPYSFTWSNVPAGSYSLTARAVDTNGAQATSPAAAVTVVPLPTVTVSATDAGASEQGPDAGTFTVSRTGATGAALTVNYTVGGTATGATDYASVGTSVTIPAGAASQVVTVMPVDDAAVESGGETVTLTLAANAAYTLGTPSSATVDIADNDTTPPSVSIATPANGTAFNAYATINITANASDPDPGGSVVKVEFFQGATKLGEDAAAPFAFSWANVAPGNYSLTAKATDNAGATTTSGAVNITVSLPTVTVSATDAAASEQGPDAGAFTVSRTGGTVTALTVNYTVGGTATGGSDYAALSGSVTIPAGAASQVVTVTPVDDAAVEGGETVTLTLAANAAYTTGASNSASVTITSNDFNPPSVSLTSPAFNAFFHWPATVTLTADASTTNPNGSISKVEFFQNNVKLGEDTTAPYSFVWTGAPAAFYQLKAKATDNLGLTTTSNVVNITVYAPPSVSIQSPAALSVFTAPASITVDANVNDPMNDLAWVSFSANGAQIGQDSTAPFSIEWNNVQAGTYHLVATVMDGGGSTFDSSVVTITVGSAPSVEVRSPEPGSAFTAPASITIEADAVSSIGLSKVEFFRNGVKLGEDASAPYSFAWANVAAGTYSLTAKATDHNGAATTSYPVSITVSNNAPPTAQLTNPAANTTFGQDSQITLGAAAADADGSIAKVEFFAGATKLGEDTTAPYSFVWTGAPVGGHSLKAVATDNLGATGASAAVNINVAAFDFPGARLDPSNRTGTEGVDFYSRNFNWALPLVSLPGRAGLDLGLSLSYNSLVWTKSGNHVLFDGDGGWPSPGFRLGFPVVQGQFYDTQTQKAAYMLVTPSGARVGLRQASQTATTTTYETGDSSYLQLTEEAGALTLVAPDGTRMKYEPRGGVFKCTEVKDRHGNFITVAYNAAGNIQQVTDTLGRVINFGYDAQGYPENITQTWRREVEGGPAQPAPETHYWARFSYDNQALDINFNADLTPVGAADGQTVRVLKRVTTSDDSYVVFDYTTWGQVHQVSKYAKDDGLLSYVKLGLPLDAAQAQGDCPRPTERRDWAAYANGDANRVGAAAEESVTTYDVVDGVTWQNPESNLPETGRRTVVVAPDGTVYREYARTAGWGRGLAWLSEFVSGGKLKKRTSTTWTQDDENLPYTQNPRVKETNVYDFNAGETVRGRRRTTLDYGAFGLPSDVREYDETAATVLRRMHTTYEPASVDAEGVYTKKRIIGLPAQLEVWEGEQTALLSKLTYDYDQPGEFLAAPEGNPASVVQHDPAHIGVGFTTRGNLTGVRRWDVADSGNLSKSVVTEIGYNTLGLVVFTRDALGHEGSISYADSDGGGRLAYPTTVTDADGFTSSTWYNYDMGVVTKSETPKPGETEDMPGPVVTRFYDAVGRALKVVKGADGSYSSWEYGASALYVKQSATVDDNYPETFTLTATDGAGRPRGVLRKLTGGAGDGYSAQRFSYDRVGREVYAYNTIKVSADAADEANVAAWQPAAEDAPSNGGTGWVYTEKEYDWMGRATREINPAVGAEATTDRLIDYEGCGCAGRAVVTVMGELVPTHDASAPAEARRTQRTHHDVLGRPVKTEVLNWGGSVYSSTTTKYDALDRVVRVRQYAGAIQEEPAGEGSAYKTTTMTYDGHGRLETVRRPEYEAGKVAAYTYNDDDTPASVSDARGATATYSYLGNNRHKATGITYGAPSLSGLAVPPAVTYTYDAAGNRSTMSTADGGEVAYNYHPTSQLASEARKFPGLAGTYTLTYQYALSGALKSVTDQTAGTSFAYTFDSAGRTTEVTSSGLGASTPLATNAQYRAWGALKSVEYGDATSGTVGYDVRGRVTGFALAGVKDSPTGPTRTDGGAYQYYSDGALKFATDNRSNAVHGGIHDRSYSYDHAGRMKTALSGAAARSFVNGTGPGPVSGPYSHSFSYDAWGNRTGQAWRLWSKEDDSSDAYDPATGRHAAPWEYDADGRFISKNEESPNELTFVPARYSYDAAGRLFRKTQTTSRQIIAGGAVITTAVTTADTFDGDGVGVRRDIIRKLNNNQPTTQTTYYLRSSVLGGRTVTEYNTAGARKTSYAWAGGEVLAQQTGVDGSAPRLKFQHVNPVTGDGRETDAAGTLLSATYLDPDGVNVGVRDPFDQPAGDPSVMALSGESPMAARVAEIMASYNDMNCSIDGILSSCRMANSLLSSGAAVQCPQNNCGPRTVTMTYDGRSYSMLSDPFSAYADGRSGFMTAGTLLPDGFSLTLTGDRARDAAAAFDLAMLTPGGTRYGFGLVLSAYGPGGFAWYEAQWDHGKPSADPGRKRRETYPGVLENIDFVAAGGTSVDDNRDKIVGQLQKMAFSRRCTELFHKAGLKTPDDIIQAGVVISAASSLSNPSNNSAFGITEPERQAYRQMLTPRNAWEFIGGLTVPGSEFTDGRARIWLTADGMRKAFTETIIHEMMHAAGATRARSAWGGHDLSGFEKNGVTYQDIINACK